MARGFLSTLGTTLVAGTIGFGLGVYAAPTEGMANFRAMLESRVGSVIETINRKSEKPETPATTPA